MLENIKNIYNSNYFNIYLKYYFIICIICLIIYFSYSILNNKIKNYSSSNINNSIIENYDSNIISENINKININTKINNNINKKINNKDILDNGDRKDFKKNLDNNLNNNLNIEKNNKKDKIFNLFWTGGYDSTFRLCEMLLVEDKIVQPYYINFELDNDKNLIEKYKSKLNNSSENNNYIDDMNPNEEITVFFRNNRKQEEKAMNNVIKYIKENYPEKAYRLLPIIYINKDIDDEEFNKVFDELFYSNNLFPEKRKIHQYYYLFKFAYYYKIFVDIGVLGIHKTKLFAQFLNKYLKKIKEVYYTKNYNEKTLKYEIIRRESINYRIPFKEHYMYYINYPLHGRSKLDLLEKAKKYNFDKILYLSWSCWFPNPENGKACGKCPMCKERII